MKFLIALLALLLSTACHGTALNTIILCKGVTTVSKTGTIAIAIGAKTIQGNMTVSSGSGTGAITIEGSMDGTWFDSLGTLAITDTVSDSVTMVTPNYLYFRCNVTGITGTGASINVTAGN